jgi:hypothetical protein
MSNPASHGEALDLSEKGRNKGEVISLNRRLFMKFTAFGGCTDIAPVAAALEASGLTGALYVDANDHRGIGVVISSEDPDCFINEMRQLFSQPPFAELEHKPEFDMLGRTYSIGYEPDLVETLLRKPVQKLTNPETPWAVWYPLQRAKGFYRLPHEQQMKILSEHGNLAHRYAAGGNANDLRLACHGLDRNDNDFVVGLIGPNLHPLSAVVQEMRKTEQTAQYLDSLGPFFIGKAVWQSAMPDD